MSDVYQNIEIQTYVIHLPERTDRLSTIQQQFEGKGEFDVTIMKANKHDIGAVGLWQSILKIITNAIANEDEIIIFCEDDLLFTPQYSSELLIKQIGNAKKSDAVILLGGVSWFKDAVQISHDLFWVEKFSGLQFTVVFKKFYEKILPVTFSKTNSADYRISDFSDKKFIIYPFISTQKKFGYSDVTNKNNEKGFVENLFKETSERLRLIKDVNDFIKLYSVCKKTTHFFFLSMIFLKPPSCFQVQKKFFIKISATYQT